MKKEEQKPKTDDWLDEKVVKICGEIAPDPNDPGNDTLAKGRDCMWLYTRGRLFVFYILMAL